MIAKHTILALAATALTTLIAHTQANATAKIGEMCGGIAGIACADGLWCDSKTGQCNTADVAGICIQVPRFCTRDYRPVCGCDGRTYGNNCTRQSAKAAMNYKGECGNRRR